MNRIGKDVFWIQEDCEEKLTLATQHLLCSELTVDSAIQIALFNNPEVQALLEEIGIAQADLVQAGLLKNPVFEGLIGFPDNTYATINTQFSIMQNFIDILLVPLRKKIAEAEFEQAQLKVAHAILNLSFDLQENFYSLQAQQAKLKLMEPLIEITEGESLLAKGQMQEGNINQLEYQSRIKPYLEAKVELTRTQAEIIRLREKMHKLLGLGSSEICWSIRSQLPDLPPEEISLSCLEEGALSQRLDLEAARWKAERWARMLGINQWWAYTNTAIGISKEKDSEGIDAIGPTFSLELPLFNYGQADRARIRSMARQSLDHLKALEIAVLSEVRSARDRLLIFRKLVKEYQTSILPLQQQILSASQEFYNSMALNVYKLLNAKSQELQMQINYVSTLRDYWISRVALDRALDGTLNLVLANANGPICIENREGSE